MSYQDSSIGKREKNKKEEEEEIHILKDALHSR